MPMIAASRRPARVGAGRERLVLIGSPGPGQDLAARQSGRRLTANRRAPQRQNLSLTLLWSLAHQPTWFGGIVAVIAGFLLQAAALGSGQLSVVAPILVIELPATLILASRIFRLPMHRREWAAALAMTAGLAGLLDFLSPGGGHPRGVRWSAWVTGMSINLAFVAVMVAWGRRGPAGREGGRGGSSDRQAAVLAVAAGASFGPTAALMKAMVGTFSQGLGALFTSWQLSGMIAAGALAMFLLQSAMNAGRLIAAQPGLTLANPVVAILWGVLAFDEHVRSGWFLALAAGSALVVAAAVVLLARSPLLSGHSSHDHHRPATTQGPGTARPADVGDGRPGSSDGQQLPARGSLRGGKR